MNSTIPTEKLKKLLKYPRLAALELAYLDGKIDGFKMAMPDLDKDIDQGELAEAQIYFSGSLDDMTDQEIIDNYRQCMKSENLDREVASA